MPEIGEVMFKYVIVLMLVAIIVILVADYNARRKIVRMKERKEEDVVRLNALGKYPFTVRPAFLNYNEMPFFELLTDKMPPNIVVCPKISLQNILSVNATDKNKDSDLKKLSSKKVDFLLCENTTMKPIVAIELGSMPVTEDEIFTEKACKDSGIKFARVPMKERYSLEDLEEILLLVTSIKTESFSSYDSTGTIEISGDDVVSFAEEG